MPALKPFATRPIGSWKESMRKQSHSTRPSIWCSAAISQNWIMQKTSSHVPFAQLPVEARYLFFIYASAALARYRSEPPTTCELAPELQAAWNRNQFNKSDLFDPDRLTQLLDEYFAPPASNVTGRAAGQRSGRLCR